MAASSAPATTGRCLGGSTVTTRHAGRGSGAYERGTDPAIDRALGAIGPLRALISQPWNEKRDMQHSLNALLDTARAAGLGGQS